MIDKDIIRETHDIIQHIFGNNDGIKNHLTRSFTNRLLNLYRENKQACVSEGRLFITKELFSTEKKYNNFRTIFGSPNNKFVRMVDGGLLIHQHFSDEIVKVLNQHQVMFKQYYDEQELYEKGSKEIYKELNIRADEAIKGKNLLHVIKLIYSRQRDMSKDIKEIKELLNKGTSQVINNISAAQRPMPDLSKPHDPIKFTEQVPMDESEL